MQKRYDNAYVQCMYAKGQQVPLPAGVAARDNVSAPTTVAPASGSYPPPGTPPPPGY